ncbi:MAG: Fic family protein [Bdellovibrionales bacterium]|nr:Fic family protein [Bdellovibrionales bacterium]
MLDPKNLPITAELLNIIAEIDEFKGAWKALGSLAPERLAGLKKVATIESIGSSTRIEGSKLTNREIESLLGNLAIRSFSSRDEQEVAGYAEVMDTIFQSFSDIPITENHIKQFHRDLLKYSEKDSRHRGSYKTSSNSVAAFNEEGKQIGIVFETASPYDTPRYMAELVEWINSNLETKALHPLLVISVFIVVFLEIHPFQDGNGRLSRILTNLLLLKCGYAYTPYSSLESVVEQSKGEYYQALRSTQKAIRTENQDWQPWLHYFLLSLRAQKRKLEEKVKRERILIEQIPELSLKILDHVREHGRVTIGEMATLAGESRNTLKVHFRRLVKDGQLRLNGKGRGAWYSLV